MKGVWPSPISTSYPYPSFSSEPLATTEQSQHGRPKLRWFLLCYTVGPAIVTRPFAVYSAVIEIHGRTNSL